jgi:uracil-DNA glycosylase family 4
MGRDPGKRLDALNREIMVCRTCPRLVAWRERVAREKRASFQEDDYWGRPVPSFGDPQARLLIVGLAPAAHGANRTGRMFTGDRSGDWLFRALHRAGFANRAEAVSRNDGLTLQDAWLTASVHCAPPDNKPIPAERKACRRYLERELELFLPRLRVVVALGGFAWTQLYRTAGALGLPVPRPRPSFGHATEAPLTTAPDAPTVLASYHPSQQNTFTGRLTEEMFDAVWRRARSRLEA